MKERDSYLCSPFTFLLGFTLVDLVKPKAFKLLLIVFSLINI